MYRKLFEVGGKVAVNMTTLPEESFLYEKVGEVVEIVDRSQFNNRAMKVMINGYSYVFWDTEVRVVDV